MSEHQQIIREVLDEALEDEYRARATYRAVLARFGDIRPFSNIVESEQRHVNALLTLYDDHGLTPIEDRWDGNVEAPSSIEEGCRRALQAEVDNGAMYERLLDRVDDPDVVAVLTRLHDASTERHMPAFRRCVERGGRGRGRRGRCAGSSPGSHPFRDVMGPRCAMRIVARTPRAST